MKIAIMSDSHDHWELLQQAVEIANQNECAELWFAGDLVSPSGVLVLKNFSGEVRLVLGNNEGELFGLFDQINQAENVSFDQTLSQEINRGSVYEAEAGGLRVFMNHYAKFGKLAAKSGEYDVVIYGHDHTYHKERVGDCWLLNPGALTSAKNNVPTFMIFDTNDRSVEKIIL